MSIAKIALDVPLDILFDYTAQDLGSEHIGRRVVVPFGRRQQVGVVVDIVSHSDLAETRLKPVTRMLDGTALSAHLLELLRFCSRYYHHPLGEVILNALPAFLRKTEVAKPSGQCFRLTAAGRAVVVESLGKRAVLKRKLLIALQAGELTAQQLLAVAPGYRPALREFIRLGWVEIGQVSAQSTSMASAGPGMALPGPALSAEQAVALKALLTQPTGFQVWLLHGVTGSGKTEVYLNAIAPLVAQGRQVLVLVPEINLTPQLEQTFRDRFPATPLATLHSSLSDGERAAHWLQAQSGAARIVLGTRLAVYAPLPQLAMIIVDEEHDASFKQQEGFRYSARDVAVARGKLADVPVLLGSATPSLETYYNALQGRYRLLSLTRRAAENAALPEIKLLDTRRCKLTEGLAEPLLAGITARLQRGEQSLLFINRRGFAPVLLCGECGWSSGCTRCASKLVVHLRERKLRCHHCGHEAPIPAHCPECGNLDLKTVGHGTQRVEEALTRIFPAARILRVDRDSTRRKHAFADMLGQVHGGRVDILVGTQMLAKGHDFPNLTLVGVLNADSALYSADFRASERLFAQLMQVSGRAGRAATPGEVLIQTQFPEHALFQSLLRHDYPGYAQTLLAERQQADFPPFAHQALLRAEAAALATALAFLEQARLAIVTQPPAVTVYDPVAAPMQRLAGKERAQLLVQSASRAALQAFLSQWLPAVNVLAGNKLRWSVDVDPLDI